MKMSDLTYLIDLWSNYERNTILIMSKTESESVRIGVTKRDDSLRFFFFKKKGESMVEDNQ